MKARKHITLPPRLMEQLLERAEQEEETVSAIVTRALRLYFAQNGQTQQSYAPPIDSHSFGEPIDPFA